LIFLFGCVIIKLIKDTKGDIYTVKRKAVISVITLILITVMTSVILNASTENRNTFKTQDHTYDDIIKQAKEEGIYDITDDKYGLTMYTYYNTFIYLLYSDPDFYGVRQIGRWYSYPSNRTVQYFLDYVDDYSVLVASYKRRFQQVIKEVKALLPDNPTDFDIVLTVYDYLVSTTAYDKISVDKEYDKTETAFGHWSIYDASGAFLNHAAVCQGSALSFKAIMREFGIDCLVAVSYDANHAWNLVKIDGEWYHLDCSDDTTYDILGYVNHENFLVSTSYFAPEGTAKSDFVVIPEDWNLDFYDETCATSTKYQNSTAAWKKSKTTSYSYKGDLYTVSPYNYIQKNGRNYFLPDDSYHWYPQSFPTANYPECMIRISGYENYLYMISPTKVYKINLDEASPDSAEVVYSIDTKENGLIFGLARIEGKLYCAIDKDAHKEPETWIHIPGEDVYYTDLNGDGKTDILDAIVLKKKIDELNGETPTPEEIGFYDVTLDGVIDEEDIQCITYYLLNDEYQQE